MANKKVYYQEQIKNTILGEIKRHNQYLEDNIDQITETNELIKKNVQTEFLSIKYLKNEYYEPICVDSELNTDFSKLVIDKNFEDAIESIAIEINTDYQSLFLKSRNNEMFFDFEAIKTITLTWMISCVKYIKLLIKFKDPKQGMRPLTKYKNAINNISWNSIRTVKNSNRKGI